MKLSVILFLLFFASVCNAQNDAGAGIDSLAGQLVKCIRSNNKEKVMLNTDRRMYTAGETIYFKAYLTDKLRNHLQTAPKKLYVDLVDKEDKVVAHLLLNAAALKTNGDFKLNDTLSEGFYWLRAYTKKMIDENGEGMSVEPVYVVNANKKGTVNNVTVKQASGSVTKPVIELFPEGGAIISGITTAVGLKITDAYGFPLNVKGYIKQPKDTSVIPFVTNEKGLGKFIFSPNWYSKYSVYIQTPSGYDSVKQLPVVNPFSAQLAVTQQSDQFATVRVALEDSLYSKDYSTYLIGLSEDSLCFASVGKGMYNVNVPLTDFPPGVAKLLLFNTRKQLLSERDIYINKENYHLTITTDKPKYAAREKASINISVTDANDKPLLAALAVTVVEEKANKSDLSWNTDTLQNLSAADADLIVLTTKPKEEICLKDDLQDEAVQSFKDDDTLIKVRGVVYDAKRQVLPNTIVSIIANSKSFLFASDTTDSDGRFEILLPEYDNSEEFKVQVSRLNGRKEDNYQILYDHSNIAKFSTPVELKRTFELNKEFQQVRSLLQHKQTAQQLADEELKDVKVKTFTKPKEGRQFRTITADMIGEGGANMVSNAVLRVPGVHYVQGLLLIGGLADMNGPNAKQEPLVFMDGIQQNLGSPAPGESSPVITFLNSLTSKDIGSIEVLTGGDAAIYGIRGGNGVIIIHSARYIESPANEKEGLSSVQPAGFYVSPPFPTPDYAKKEVRNSQVQDMRTTIYWNGDILTGNDGKASVQFFTADTPATYIITVTGISANGDKLYKSTTVSRK